MNYSSSRLPNMRSSRHSSQTDSEKIHLCLLFLNIYNRFYPLQGVAVTVIGVGHLNCASMRDSDCLNVLGGNMNGLPAFMDSIMVLHVLLCFFLNHLYMNNHNYILLYEYTHRWIKIIFSAMKSSGKWHFFLGGLSYLFSLKEFLRQISKIRHLTCLEIFEL